MSSSPILKSATTAPTPPTTKPPSPTSKASSPASFPPISSNWRSHHVADEYLEHYHVPVISEIDTRALVRHLRTHGVMRGVISTTENNPEVLVQKARSIRKMDGTDLASVVSTKDRYEWEPATGPDPLAA